MPKIELKTNHTVATVLFIDGEKLQINKSSPVKETNVPTEYYSKLDRSNTKIDLFL